MSQVSKLPLPDAAITESMTESVLVTTADLDAPGPYIVYVNPAFERMTGWSGREVVGRSPGILQGPKTDLTTLANLRESLDRDRVWKGQAVNYRKDGSEFVMEWSIVPLCDPTGNLTHYLAVQRDVTVRVRLEQELAAARKAELEFAAKLEVANRDLSTVNEAQRRTLEAFMKYVPESVARKAIDSRMPHGPERGELAYVTMLFCDLRGFTAHCENLSPDRVVHVLNTYYRSMSEVIKAHDGMIQQYVGDEIFVVFGAPLPVRYPEEKAVRCAIAMVKRLAQINESLRTDLQRTLEVKIGINCGTVVAGNLGSDERLAYSIVGDAVNIAKKIESRGRMGGNTILVSEAVIRQTADLVVSRPLPKVHLEGTRSGIEVHQVLRLRSPSAQSQRGQDDG